MRRLYFLKLAIHLFFCLLIINVSRTVLLVHYLFSDVFLVFQGQKTKLSLLLFRLGRQVFGLLSENYTFLSNHPIILFLYPLCVGLLLKKQCSASCLSSLIHVLCLHFWLVWLLKSSFVYLKKELPSFVG